MSYLKLLFPIGTKQGYLLPIFTQKWETKASFMSTKSPFRPPPLPPENLSLSRHIGLIGEARASIAQFDARLSGIHTPDLLLFPLLTREAVLSSKIEGTEATLEDVLKFEADPTGNKSKMDDVGEVLNYREALLYGEQTIRERSFSIELITGMHQILLKGVRGGHKTPGAFRKKQNWVGKPDSKIEEATYIPPYHWDVLPCIRELVDYYRTKVDTPLVQIALLHAQFEMIHPFLDGNGRIGRLIIPLFMYEKALLQRPTFYLSAYLEKQRQEYYRRLQAISQNGEWNEWVEYFLTAIIEQARHSSERIQKIQLLYENAKQEIPKIIRSQHATQAIDFLFSNPIFSIPRLVQSVTIGSSTAARIVDRLEKGRVVTKIVSAQGRRPAMYEFTELLNIVN